MSNRGSRVLCCAVVTLATVGLLSGCRSLDSFTGDQAMKWVGHDLLPQESVKAPTYQATAAMPGLKPKDVTAALGWADPTTQTPTTASGVVGMGSDAPYAVQVNQTMYATRIAASGDCQEPVKDQKRAILATQRMVQRLGEDPQKWSWFTVTAPDGPMRVVGEPILDGVQTWSTGLIAAQVAEAGVCGFTASLMKFNETGEQVSLDSAYDQFQYVRHDDSLTIPGEYDAYRQTWTLKEQGRLIPLWEFDAEDHGIVVVDLGDGLESALNTESALQEALVKDAAATQ